jgi:hypothetical protein
VIAYSNVADLRGRATSIDDGSINNEDIELSIRREDQVKGGQNTEKGHYYQRG